MPLWNATYTILSYQEDPPRSVGGATTIVEADNRAAAIQAVHTWVDRHDYRYDDRIDPYLRIEHLTLLDEGQSYPDV